MFRNLLTELVQSDPSYSWFVSEDVNIPAVRITDFWEDENSSVYLSEYGHNRDRINFISGMRLSKRHMDVIRFRRRSHPLCYTG